MAEGRREKENALPDEEQLNKSLVNLFSRLDAFGKAAAIVIANYILTGKDADSTEIALLVKTAELYRTLDIETVDEAKNYAKFLRYSKEQAGREG